MPLARKHRALCKLPSKFRSVRVEFCSSASAKAWHGDKWLQKHEFRIIKISKTKFQAAKPDQTIGASWLVAHQWCIIPICSSFRFHWRSLVTVMWMIVLQHGRSTKIHSAFFTKILSARWLHFQVPVSYSLLCPFFSTSSPNTKPSRRRHRCRYPSNSSSSK